MSHYPEKEIPFTAPPVYILIKAFTECLLNTASAWKSEGTSRARCEVLTQSDGLGTW